MNSYTHKGIMAAALLAVTGLSSCMFEDDDKFDESASLRIESYIEETADILVSSEQGWVMQYFCGTQNAQYEGFNLFAKFYDSYKVLMASNHRYLRDGNAGSYTEDESIYSFTEEDGPVLAFDTWNDILTVFADPVSASSAPTTIVSDGVGMNGDYNFVIESYSEDTVKLRGMRYSASVQLVKCTMDWQEYISQTAALKSYITNSSINNYYLTNGTDTMYLSGLINGRMRYSEQTTDPLQNDSLACCFTPDGFHIENEQTLGDSESTFQDFVLAEDSSCLVSGDVQCIAMWDDYAATHTGLWAFDTSEFTTAMTTAYNDIADALAEYNSNYQLRALCLGKSTGGNSVNGIVACFYSNAAKSKTNNCGISMTSALNGYGQVTLTADDDPSMDANLTSMNKKVTALATALQTFATLVEGTYTMTPDNYFLPTGATYDEVDGSRSFTLELWDSSSSSSSSL